MHITIHSLAGVTTGLTLVSLVLTGIVIHDHLRLTELRDKQVWHEIAIQTLEDAFFGDQEAISKVKTSAFVRLKTSHQNDQGE